METEIADAHAGREGWLDERAGRIGEEQLPAMAGGSDACRPVDVQPHIAVAAASSLARVQAHADPDGRSLRPLLLGQRALRGSGCGQGIGRGGEGHEERVAFGGDLDSCAVADRGPHDVRMPVQQIPIAVRQLGQDARGAFDIGEQERHRTGR